jgi:hypothetical protein
MKDIPAFPNPLRSNDGMTLRDYFAAKLCKDYWPQQTNAPLEPNFAKQAYKVADAMMKAREE